MYGSSFITSSGVFSSFDHDSGAGVLGGVFSFDFPLLSVFIILCLPVGDRLFCGRYGEDGRFTGYWMMGDYVSSSSRRLGWLRVSVVFWRK